MAKQRKIRGSKGPIYIIVLMALLCTGAVFVGKFLQDTFMGVVESELGLKTKEVPLPPNPASKPAQM